MPVILIETDPFSAVESELTLGPTSDDAVNVRRPLQGTSIKEARFAFLSLFQDVGTGDSAQTISMLDSSAPGGYSDANHNFILQGVSESRTERVQIVETFGDHFAFFYGESPIVLQVQGMLLNTEDFNWKNEFVANYAERLRGTKCVENRTRVYLGYDDVIAQGYILNLSINMSSELPLLVPFSFSMLLARPPEDLSAADSPMRNPKPSDVPWTYRSLALAGDPSALFPEYLTEVKATTFVKTNVVQPVVAPEVIQQEPIQREPRVAAGLKKDVVADPVYPPFDLTKLKTPSEAYGIQYSAAGDGVNIWDVLQKLDPIK